MKTAFIGECMLEFRHLQHWDLGFGGDTLNTALYLARLSAGDEDLQVSYITALGQDAYSQQLLHNWQQEGIDTGLVLQLADKNPGLYLVETDASGERSFAYWRSDAAARYLFDRAGPELMQALCGFDCLYLSGISLAVLTESGRSTLYTALGQARAAGCRILFDNNYRPALWQSAQQARENYRKIMALADTAFLTFDDEQALYGDIEPQQSIDRARSCGIREVIIKQGADACIAVCGDQYESLAPQAVSRVVDTTAAGDSFAAGYLSARLRQQTLITSIKQGHELAAAVIQHPGAVIPAAAMPGHMNWRK